MSNSTGLSDNQQALAVFFTALVAALVGWATAGFPTTRLAIGALVAAILVGVGLALKEWMGSTATVTPVVSTPATATPKASATPTTLFKIKKRLMFLQLRK